MSLFWGRWGHEKNQDADTEGLRYRVGVNDVEVVEISGVQPADLRAGYTARFR